jgi:uncharacterized membrane protein YqjE
MTAAVDPTRPLQPDKSLGDLFGELGDEFSGLLQAQLELAKVELRDEAQKLGKTAGMFGGAAVAGYFTLLLLSFALAWGLANVMDAGWAFLIVGAIWGIAAAVLYAQGRARAREVNLKPEQTIASFKEDVQWAKQRMS